MPEPSDRDDLEAALDHLRQQRNGIPRPKPVRIVLAALVSVICLFGFVVGLLSLLEKQAQGASPGGFRGVFGLAFFLFPLMLSLRSIWKNYQNGRERKLLTRAETRIMEKLKSIS